MKISIITVCKNSKKYIEKAINSVISQSYKNIEYIIIDGDSQDGTKQIIEQFTKFIDKFVSEPDSGLYAAMNKGIKLATGEFIYFLNSDDWLVDQNVVEDVVAFISKHSDCDFVYGDVETRSVLGKISIAKPSRPENIAEEMICLGNCPIQPACLFKANLFSKLGFFNESYKIASDYEWFTRLLQDETLKLYYYSRTIVSYYCGGLSSDIKAVFTEVFEIQNKSLLYRSDYWNKKRISKLQESIINMKILSQKIQKLSDERKVIIEKIQLIVEIPEPIIVQLIRRAINLKCWLTKIIT